MTDSELDRYMRMYYKIVYSVALCGCKNPDDAYDIAQDVFLKLYTSDIRFTGDEHVKAWLLRCAMNRSTDHVRSYWFRNSRPLEDASDKVYRPGQDTEGHDLLKLVMKLGRNERAVMYLHYYEYYTVKELSVMLGASEQALRSRLRRGKARLKKLLENERNE